MPYVIAAGQPVNQTGWRVRSIAPRRLSGRDGMEVEVVFQRPAGTDYRIIVTHCQPHPNDEAAWQAWMSKR